MASGEPFLDILLLKAITNENFSILNPFVAYENANLLMIFNGKIHIHFIQI